MDRPIVRRTCREAALIVVLISSLVVVIIGVSYFLPEPRFSPNYGDLSLYREIAMMVGQGKSYWASAVDLHRQHNYPLRPFYTVRLPTLAYVYAVLGPRLMMTIAWVLSVTLFVCLYRSLRTSGRFVALVGLALAVLAVTPSTNFSAMALHEYWVGMFVALAIMLPDKPLLRIGLAGLACLVREHAVLFLIICGGQALIARDWRQVALALAALVPFVALVLLDYRQLAELVYPQDIYSPGWSGMRGMAGIVRDLSMLSWLGLMPLPLRYVFAFLPMVGWLLAPPAIRNVAVPWFGGVLLAVGLFARADNFYWAQLLLPAWFCGIAFMLPGKRGAWRARPVAA